MLAVSQPSSLVSTRVPKAVDYSPPQGIVDAMGMERGPLWDAAHIAETLGPPALLAATAPGLAPATGFIQAQDLSASILEAPSIELSELERFLEPIPGELEQAVRLLG